MSVHILYHGGCTDGHTAAWACLKKHPNSKTSPCAFNQPPPEVTKDEDVIMVDFAFSRGVLLDLKDRAHSLVVLDHHISNKKALDGLPFCYFDMFRSGAGLAWDYMFAGTPRPRLVDYVEDRDLWNWRLPYSKEVSSVIQSYAFEFEHWDRLDNRLELDFDNVVREGQAILRAEEQSIERIASNVSDVTIAGRRVPATNSIVCASEVGNLLCRDKPFAAVWHVNRDQEVVFSLRSDENGEDVSLIAGIFDGGGHRRASGFRVDLERAMTMFTPRGLT